VCVYFIRDESKTKIFHYKIYKTSKKDLYIRVKFLIR